METKTFICLAKSIRDGAYCIGGKELISARFIGRWFRPVDRNTDAVSGYEVELIRLFDIVSCNVEEYAPIATQPENWMLAENPAWRRIKPFPRRYYSLLLDTPNTLWGYGYSSSLGINDKVPELEAIKFNSSLLFVFVSDARLSMVHDEARNYRRVRMDFHYNNIAYNFVVTYNVLSRQYWNQLFDGPVSLPPCYLTLSLAKQYYGNCYKLVVGHVQA